MDATECGIVKLPRMQVADNIAGGGVMLLGTREDWLWISNVRVAARICLLLSCAVLLFTAILVSLSLIAILSIRA